MLVRHRRRLPSPAIVVAVLALVVSSAGVGYAANGDGLVLGVLNNATARTRLVAPTNEPSLTIENSDTGTNATALRLNVAPGNPPLVVNSRTRVANLNADRLDGLHADDLQRRVTGSCLDGTSVQSVAADGSVTCEDVLREATYASVSGDAYDAQQLDGRDSTQFMLGAGEVFKGARAIPKGTSGWLTVLETSDPYLRVGYSCPADLATNGVLVFVNSSPELVNVFSDNGSVSPEYRQLPASGGRWDQWSAAVGEHITIQVQGAAITTFEINAVHRAASNDCHVQAQAIVSR